MAPGELHERVEGQTNIDFSKEKVKVWRPEEKQTDVNIAIHMTTDAFDDKCEQQVLVSNDSDCAPILETIKHRFPTKRIGVIAPILEHSRKRKPSADLTGLADWSRRVIHQRELAAHQLPDKVKVIKRRTRIRKRPSYWEASTELD